MPKDEYLKSKKQWQQSFNPFLSNLKKIEERNGKFLTIEIGTSKEIIDTRQTMYTCHNGDENLSF